MTVIDAGVIVVALTDDGTDGAVARARMQGASCSAPELIDLETTSGVRRLHAAGQLDARRAEWALAELLALPIRRRSHRPLVTRCWELRHNLTIYDAAYVALAESLQTVLITADARLAGAPGPRCEIELLSRA